MKYSKPALTFDEQADQLLARGLVADRSELLARLQSVSYYRLSAYWYPFRLPDADVFQEGTTLREVWRRYTFDRHLRLVVLDAVERVEVSVRTELTYALAHEQGPFGYLQANNLPNLPPDKHREFLDQLARECANSREHFMAHFYNRYGDEHEYPPYWMVTELMTFGMLLTLYRGSPRDIKKRIARRFGVADPVFESWLRALNGVRNICAHHGRLWNRELGYKPLIPKPDRRWHDPVEVTGKRVFGILTILKFLLDEIAPQSRWPQRLQELLDQYRDVPTESMGFADAWERCPIWGSKN